ncbi:hypothetical protein RND71_035455 [Anisodus tanguticus]|uniref:Reverse transcriptase Ty1/copia-type domain-containing protein n=1 Tax=Anisodus tanguticus TaxID=243964 RepID=A0AAE1V1L4_9SOLA|nr:hypothetical protein RND71_035455 [Anisodus tanguticus]
MDVKTAFLNGDFEEEIYMDQPEGYVVQGQEKKVCRLVKSLYGLKQAPKQWHKKIDSTLLSKGFAINECDKCVYMKGNSDSFVMICLYVDDMLITGNSPRVILEIVEAMSTTFEMSMIGELTFFLGLQIKQNEDEIFVSQNKYAENLVRRFVLKNAKHMKTPMGSTQQVCKDDVGQDVDPPLYRSMIGSLLYLTASRPDIMFSVCVCARFQSSPKVSHLNVVKRIIRYVAGTSDLGIWYSKDTNSNLIGYSDSNCTGDVEDRKSTSGGCFYLGNNLVSWYNRKQNCISLLTAEYEYVAAGSCCAQLIWLRHMLDGYGISDNSMILYCDNLSAINIFKNPVQHSRTKHIDIRYHFLRDLVEKQLVQIKHVDTLFQLADIFTKPLDHERFSSLRKSLGLGFL